eukprot:74088-Rhodomonas_salina.1
MQYGADLGLGTARECCTDRGHGTSRAVLTEGMVRAGYTAVCHTVCDQGSSTKAPSGQVCYAICLRARYAMPGIDIACRATCPRAHAMRCPLLT